MMLQLPVAVLCWVPATALQAVAQQQHHHLRGDVSRSKVSFDKSVLHPLYFVVDNAPCNKAGRTKIMTSYIVGWDQYMFKHIAGRTLVTAADCTSIPIPLDLH